jgi:hypothetical protein
MNVSQCEGLGADEIMANEDVETSCPRRNDHMIQALAANGADHPFDIGTLPGRPWRRKHWLDAHGLHRIDEILPEDPMRSRSR